MKKQKKISVYRDQKHSLFLEFREKSSASLAAMESPGT